MTSIKSLPLIAVGLFLAAHVVVPLVWGDIYPFTSAPMFRDRPGQYCNYHVFATDGTELPQEDWLVQRVYDGNPVGYGVGIRPPGVIEQEYGVVHSEEQVRAHILDRLTHDSANRHFAVTVEQRVFGPRDEGTIGLLKTNTWHVSLPSP